MVYPGRRSGYGEAVVRIASLLMRRVAMLVTTLLLGLAVASPAIAEIGCSWAAATHFAEVAGYAGEHEADDAGSDDGGGSGEAERDSHCAFGHGHGNLASGAVGAAMPSRIPSFALPVGARFVSSLPPGLDRPPRG